MLECQEWAVAPVEPHGIPAALHDATTAATHRVSVPRVGTGMVCSTEALWAVRIAHRPSQQASVVTPNP